MKLTNAPVGLLLNFHVPLLKKGIRRFLNKDHELVNVFDPVAPSSGMPDPNPPKK